MGGMGGPPLYTAPIKVLGGFVIPKEFRQWHNRLQTTHRQTNIVTYRLGSGQLMRSFVDRSRYGIISTRLWV